MSSSLKGGGGEETMYLKHCEIISKKMAAIRGEKEDAYIQALRILLLLLVYDTEAEVNLVGLFEGRLHLHHLGECLLSVLERAVPIVQYSYAVPELGFLPHR